MWGYICSDEWHWYWNSANMIVLCRQLGYHSDKNCKFNVHHNV